MYYIPLVLPHSQKRMWYPMTRLAKKVVVLVDVVEAVVIDVDTLEDEAVKFNLRSHTLTRSGKTKMATNKRKQHMRTYVIDVEQKITGLVRVGHQNISLSSINNP